MTLSSLLRGLPINSANLATQTITNKHETTYHPVFITGHSFLSNN
jgi:hypothetical protein